MSNISRRKFLKDAGAAALAVAAAGVLGGCSGDNTPDVPGTPDVPDVPGVTSKTIKLVFVCDGETVKTGSMSALLDATSIQVSAIPADQLPAGYNVESTGALEIGEDDTVRVEVSKIIYTKTVKISFVANGVILNVTGSMEVDKEAKTVLASAIPADQIPQGYTVESTGELTISEKDTVTVTLNKMATVRDVTVRFYNTDSNRFLGTTMILKVSASQRFITKNDLTEALPGYEVTSEGNVEISENNQAVMTVKQVNQAEKKEVTIYYLKEGSGAEIAKATINVDKDVTFLYANELPNVNKEVWMGKDKYLMKVEPVGNGPFRINYLGDGKGEVKVYANHKIVKA